MPQSLSVSVAAYAAVRPAEMNDTCRGPEVFRHGGGPAVVNLSKAAGFTLRLLTMRAQKPLHLTAGNFANMTLELYLTVR